MQPKVMYTHVLYAYLNTDIAPLPPPPSHQPSSFPHPGHIGIAGLGVDTSIFDDILKGIIWKTAITSLVALSS